MLFVFTIHVHVHVHVMYIFGEWTRDWTNCSNKSKTVKLINLHHEMHVNLDHTPKHENHVHK